MIGCVNNIIKLQLQSNLIEQIQIVFINCSFKTQERDPRSQRKPRRRSKQKNIRNSSKIMGLRKISTQLNPRKQLIHHQWQYTPKLGICKNKQTKKGPRKSNQVDETMHLRQPSSSNANTMNQPPMQANGNNQFLKIKLVKLVRQRLQ
ncbi:Hypothetical_protein [Hexamita inflata]|uniref:Hypothetical_protein n=1 Tax=Hexamita inflata TaxID=28002 RepID=A0ABP1H0Q2_9EUKA